MSFYDILVQAWPDWTSALPHVLVESKNLRSLKAPSASTHLSPNLVNKEVHRMALGYLYADIKHA